MTDLPDNIKRKIDEKAHEIIINNCKLYEVPANKQNVMFSLSAFLEGVKFMHKYMEVENTTIFNQKELEAIAEQYNDLLKDFPEDKLYKSISEKANEMAWAK